MSRRPAAILAFLLALSAGACGDVGVVAGTSAVHTYDGPLYLTRDEAEHPRAGAAGDVVDCGTFGGGGFHQTHVYAEGATADSPEQALKVAQSEGGFGGVHEGLRVAKQEDDRVLFVLEVEDVVKQAIIVRDGPATKGAGGAGWYVESWAHCDFSELPRTLTDSLGLQIWTDSTGRPVPTATIESWIGPEHCNWQSMTFLHLGKAVYVRDPQPDLEEFFAEAYAEHSQLPRDAVDTGFERDEDHLWLSPDRQRAFVGTNGDVEVWPRAIRRLGCV
jgi:hypothetical protein